MECMQYTIRGIPGHLDSGIRYYAQEENKSLNAALLDILEAGLKRFRKRPKNDELLELSGSWTEDADCEKVLAEMDVIDEDLWK